MNRSAGRLITALLFLVVSVGSVAVAGAQTPEAQVPSTDSTPSTVGGPQTPGKFVGPTLTVNPASVQLGQRVDVIFTDWDARLATLSVCGNDARRGAADCNQVDSQSVTLRGVGIDAPIASMVVNAPPGTCPCVMKAVGIDSRESAIVPIDIVGVPVGPIIDPPNGKLVDVKITATRADAGALAALRSSLGGATAYDVTVDVRNLTSEDLTGIEVFGAVGRNITENLATFDLNPGPIDAGRTWTTSLRVTIPSPVWGDYVWQAKASGAGPSVTATQDTRVVPLLLVVLIALMVGDLVMIVVRWLRRRRARRALEEPPVGRGEPGPGGSDGWSGGPAQPPAVDQDLVGAAHGSFGPG